MIEKIKTPIKRALRHPKAAGALLLSGIALAGPAIKPNTAQAEGSQNSSTFLKLAKETEQNIMKTKPFEAALGTLTVARRVHDAGPRHNQTAVVYDHISYPIIVQYRDLPQPVGFVPGPNQEDITNGDFAFGAMTVKNHKAQVTLSAYNPNTMTFNYSNIPGEEAYTTEDVAFTFNGPSRNAPIDFKAPIQVDSGGNYVDDALDPNGQPQEIGHVTTTPHP